MEATIVKPLLSGRRQLVLLMKQGRITLGRGVMGRHGGQALGPGPSLA